MYHVHQMADNGRIGGCMRIPSELLRLLKTASPETKQAIFDWLCQPDARDTARIIDMLDILDPDGTMKPSK